MGVEIGQIKNPEYAKFSTIEEEIVEGVNLNFKPQKKVEILKGIKKLKELK